MSFFPFNPNTPLARVAQSSVKGVYVHQVFGVRYSLTADEAATADTDYFVEPANMKVGAYTLVETAMPGNCARNVTVTHTVDSGGKVADTLGTIEVTGTDLAGNVITETITPTSGGTKDGAKAFRTVTKIEGKDWVISAPTDEDTIEVGFGDLIGLPSLLEANTVLLATLGGTRETKAPVVTSSTTVLASNTVDLHSALNDSAVDIYYVV